MGVAATLLKKLAGDHGMEIPDEELAALGLSDDDAEPTGDSTDPRQDDILSQELPGTAAGRVELFLSADSTALKDPVEVKDSELLWYPIIREGQWAVRPGGKTGKRRTPLKVVSGSSKNQRREIGLSDIKQAFDDQAVQHVTVPMSHSNTLAENTGFIDELKIVKGEVTDQTKKDKPKIKVDVLMGGYRFTEPEVKGKVMRGTFANRSAGLLYDYVDTERGKTWPVVLEHCALTNKPWITGMLSFGRPLSDAGIKLDTVAMSLSDEGPSEQEYTLSLSDEADLSEDESDFLAQESADWSKEGSPNWLQSQVNDILRERRRTKRLAAQANGTTLLHDYEDPYYRCREAKPGKALIADGYSDEANFWAAPITVKDGAVEVAEFSKWSALKKAFIPDQRPDPPAHALPLSEQGDTSSAAPKSRLQLAQEARRARASTPGPDPTTTPREVVTQDMDKETLSRLDPEVRRAIEESEARAEALAKENEQLSQKVARIQGSVQGGEVDKYIAWLKDPEDGLGLSEDKGFGGVLTEVREQMLADDGEPALQGDAFSTDDNKTGELTLSEGIKRIFSAFHKAQEGKAKIGEQLSQPADGESTSTEGDKADDEGKKDESTDTSGKPPADGDPGDTLSTEDAVNKIAETNPEVARLLGRPLVPTAAEVK